MPTKIPATKSVYHTAVYHFQHDIKQFVSHAAEWNDFVIKSAQGTRGGASLLIEQVIRCLVARNLRVGAIKHDAHRVELDRPGKDSWRLREAGAARTILAATNQLVVFDTAEQQRSVQELVEKFFPDVDVVIAEGFRTSGEPTIIVERTDGPDGRDWEPPANTVAIVSDRVRSGPLPVLPLDAPDEAPLR